MKNFISYGLILALVFINTVLVINWLEYRTLRNNFRNFPEKNKELSASTLIYGDTIPSFKTYDVPGNEVSSYSIRGKLCIFHFFRPENQYHRDVLAYTDILAKQYQGKSLFFAIGQGKLDWLIRRGFRLDNTITIADKDFYLASNKFSELLGPLAQRLLLMLMA